MGESNTRAATGVVLARGRTRVWVEREELHWQRGRRTVTVPGSQIRRVEVAGGSLTVVLFEDPHGDGAMRFRHRNETVVAALGTEIEALIGDADSSRVRRPVRHRSVRVWPFRVLARMRDLLRHGSPWWRRALWYLALGLPLGVAIPVEPRYLGVLAWLALPASFTLLRAWMIFSELDKMWVMWRRGITVQASYEPCLPYKETSYNVHFRTLDGRNVQAETPWRGRRDEVQYDPRDPSRAFAPTRVAWLGGALLLFTVYGWGGVVLGVPVVLWVSKVLSLVL
jgi:hypothetical protein